MAAAAHQGSFQRTALRALLKEKYSFVLRREIRGLENHVFVERAPRRLNTSLSRHQKRFGEGERWPSSNTSASRLRTGDADTVASTKQSRLSVGLAM